MNAIAIVILLVCLPITNSLACECSSRSFSVESTGSTEIFIGTPLSKSVADKTYYLFTVSQVFKGKITGTITIKTGFGGPDCGILFEIGKPYIVFAYRGNTNRCGRSASLETSPDLGKLKYDFQPSFSNSVGKNASPILTDNEAEYFNSDLKQYRGHFDFQGKKVAFFYNEAALGKQQYFTKWHGGDVRNQLLLLTDEEKQNSNGYDAILVSWRKQGISKRFRRHLIERLHHST